MLTLGEVHTGFLRNSTSVSRERCAQVLALIRGERVRRSERPQAYAVSPEKLRGVDCRLVAASRSRHRVIGTVTARAAITGGHALQASAYAQITSSPADRRLPWAHYLTRPGVLELLGKVDWEDAADGFLSEAHPPEGLDLGGVCADVTHAVQTSALLDQKAPVRTGRTRLRWAAFTPTGGNAIVRFGIEERGLRTLRLSADGRDPAAMAAVCEDLALHDWLLACLQALIEGSDIGAVDRAQLVRRFGPAIDHLLHLWMPAARVDRTIWDALEHRPGLTRQWNASVSRIRDQVAVATVALLSDAARVGT
ncbi:SCO2521 family protein [Actinomycetes bacterium KLBMP 9797]